MTWRHYLGALFLVAAVLAGGAITSCGMEEERGILLGQGIAIPWTPKYASVEEAYLDPRCWSGVVIDVCDPCSMACRSHDGVSMMCQNTDPQKPPDFRLADELPVPLYCQCADGAEVRP